MESPTDVPGAGPETNGSKRPRFGTGNWTALAVLLGFLGVAIAFAVYIWNQLEGVDISPQGWIAMSLGIIFTAAVGVGLMALVFYSSRRNYDR
jgi:hypothetical protein